MVCDVDTKRHSYIFIIQSNLSLILNIIIKSCTKWWDEITKTGMVHHNRTSMNVTWNIVFCKCVITSKLQFSFICAHRIEGTGRIGRNRVLSWPRHVYYTLKLFGNNIDGNKMYIIDSILQNDSQTERENDFNIYIKFFRITRSKIHSK